MTLGLVAKEHLFGQSLVVSNIRSPREPPTNASCTKFVLIRVSEVCIWRGRDLRRLRARHICFMLATFYIEHNFCVGPNFFIRVEVILTKLSTIYSFLTSEFDESLLSKLF